MSETTSLRLNPADLALARPARWQGKLVVGVLCDGTPYFVPIGQVVADGALVTCHLCGRAFRSVVAHLSAHGWTKAQYCEAFGLERGQSLEGAETRKLRSASFSARLVFEPALRDGSARGRERARSGQLTRQAAAAARGRPFPEQRRQRSRATMVAASRGQLAQANRERADQRLAAQAEQAARRQGYADIGQLVRDGLAAGQSLAAISRGCGLNKDWMSRHLGRLDPVLAAAAIARRDSNPDLRWLPVIQLLGFTQVTDYLRQRHYVEHASVNAIAREVGLSFPAVKAAFSRHGLTAAPHSAKRHAAERRAAATAASLGVESIRDYVQLCRARGWTWQQIAAAAGQPQSWLRRHAADRP
jgi:AraC-like DNA-binding protein